MTAVEYSLVEFTGVCGRLGLDLEFPLSSPYFLLARLNSGKKTFPYSLFKLVKLLNDSSPTNVILFDFKSLKKKALR